MTDSPTLAKRLTASSSQRLGVRGLCKSFGTFQANTSIDLSIDRGEIHALLGENGAGKSTLVKMIYGILSPDAGVMTLDGIDYRPTHPGDARLHGVGMVFQHFAVFDALTVLENIALGLEGRMPDQRLADELSAVCARYRMPIALDAYVSELGAGERQRLEILRVLMQDPNLLILDEPTSVLTPQETEELFATLERLADEGRSIIYISHKLDEVRALCDRATLLRSGRVVDVVDPRQESSRSLGEKMIGERLAGAARTAPPAPSAGEETVRLSVRIPDPDQPGGVQGLHALSLSVHAGSIVGIAGVAGNGQDLLFAVLSGERVLSEPDAIVVDGTSLGDVPIEGRRQHGLLSAPENRLGHAAVPELSLWENVILSARHTRRLLKNPYLISGRKAREFARDVIQTFDVRTPSVDAVAGSLSGGNLQKFLIGRELLGDPRVFVVVNPTWGVDAKAQQFIHQSLIDLADQGAAVVLISQDIDELLALSDRMGALCHGRLSALYDRDLITPERLGELMLGHEVDA